ncbi:hypothetical protein Pcinc_014254 [Petrolisthes cinctipes]|uniref:Uncharacterized protein n=1 Tax=Petrolisthes cinctipes TaxID=88211 RepID=A0AAE1KRJ5_PETCI|nr:hypothetical protein Pcinc_014254 [Petrolisthes cinctipes]
MPGRRPGIGDHSLSQGVSPLIPINTHMGRDPTKSYFAATTTQEDKQLKNGQHQGMGRVKIAQGLQGTTGIAKKSISQIQAQNTRK